MGLFSFMKDVGETLFGNNDEEKAEAVIEAIDKKGLDLKDLKVVVKGDKLTVSGEAKSSKDAEIALLVAGNFKGVAEVDGTGLKIAAPATAAGTVHGVQLRSVVVRSGDTLSKIAAEQLGSASRYMELFEANRPMLSDPNKIYPGQTLRIPSEAGAQHA